ncbi:MAG: 2-(1,2-epoxy-1,2-dihydrophenyl)acetyl-CoA isomerase [Rhodobacteraceae bacterium]|nr:2-(1,2-epoxy-1,2-dihydrophenyl)acetyl-CoA isomerase [Paracoccaceae bacterium]
MSDTIRVTTQDGWVEITLNRPDRLNSFNDEMHLALRSAMQTAADDPAIRAVLLTGEGRGFCAGQDLDGRDPRKMREPPDLGHTLSTLYNPLVRLIRGMDKPVICAVNGVAAGAGANLALACDIVLASEEAKFIQSFANVGLIPDAGGSWSLTHLLGPARAKAWAMTAEPLPAARAEAWGLIWKALPANTLMSEARAMAKKFAGGATFGLASTKRAIHAAGENSFDQQLALEAELQRACGRSPDYREGVTAFLEKRKPSFTGQPE